MYDYYYIKDYDLVSKFFFLLAENRKDCVGKTEQAKELNRSGTTEDWMPLMLMLAVVMVAVLAVGLRTKKWKEKEVT